MSISACDNYLSICAHPYPDFSYPVDKVQDDCKVLLFTQMLDLNRPNNKKLGAGYTSSEFIWKHGARERTG